MITYLWLKSSAKALTEKQRSDIAKKAVSARWGIKASHSGGLEIGEIKIPCYVLEDGSRVLSQSGLASALGLNRFAQLDKFIEGKALNPYITRSISALVNSPIKFIPPHGGKPGYGYEATTLSEICESILKARDAGVLKSNYGN